MGEDPGDEIGDPASDKSGQRSQEDPLAREHGQVSHADLHDLLNKGANL